jgi:PST family polysaccharide transporter
MNIISKALKSSLLQNTFFLFLNKGINVIVPIIIIPLCHKFFGIETYGQWVYVQSALFIFIVIFDYGFNLSAPREISLVQHEKTRVESVYSSILFFKLFVALLFGIGLSVFLAVSKNPLTLIFTFTYLSLALQSLIPYWFFQGVKSNIFILIINLLSKLIFFIPIYLTDLSKKQIYFIPYLEAISYLITFLLAIVVIRVKFGCSLKKIDLVDVKKQLIEGKDIFITSLLSWVVISGSVIIVEYFCSKIELGYFATFTRLGYYLYAIFQPINHAVFPFVSVKFAESQKAGQSFLRKIEFGYYILVVLLITLIIFSSTHFFKFFLSVNFVVGFADYSLAFVFICLWIGFLLINNFLGIQFLLASKQDKLYRNLFLINALTTISGFILLVPFFNSAGAALAMCLGELSFLICYFILKPKYILFS